MAEQEQNRSEPATPFKLSEARKQGKVARSVDLNSFMSVSALLLLLLIGGDGIALHLGALWRWLLGSAGHLQLESIADTAWLHALLADTCTVLAPFLLVAVACGVLANLLQTGPVFTFEPLQPKFERLNPVSGFRRVFNRRMLFEGVKTLIKLGLFGVVLYGFLLSILPKLADAADADSRAQVAWLAAAAGTLLFRLALVLLLVGIVDCAYVRWQFSKQMMMSRRELREEIKRREGDPAVRARIRELQRENLKQARSLGSVPEADVLITNPQHLAVALRYVRGEMNAPHVIAKGAESWAAEMRELARRHGVLIVERKPLARHLFMRGQIGHPIPSDSFVDVARVYVEVEAARRRAARYEVRQ